MAEFRFELETLGVIRLSGERQVLGRHEECDLVVTHEKISKRHAEVSCGDEGWCLRDLGSTNGTRVGGVSCSTPTPLLHGQRVHFGGLVAIFHDPAPAEAAVSGQRPPTGETRPRPKATPAVRRPAPRVKRKSSPVATLWWLVVIVGLTLSFLVVWDVYRSQQDGSRELALGPARNPGPVSGAGSSSPGSPPPTGGEPIGGTAGDGDPRPPIDPAPLREPNQGEPDDDPTQESDEPGSDPIETSLGRTEGSIEERGAPGGGTPPVREVSSDAPPAIEPLPEEEPRGSAAGSPEASAVVPSDPFAEALAEGDAGRLARLLTMHPRKGSAEEARRRLQSETIYILSWSGALSGGGNEILARAFPLHAGASDRTDLENLPFPVRTADRTVRVRFQHDYSVGLGRQVGDTRLAPHPRKVTVEIGEPRDGKKPRALLEVTGETPHVPGDEIPENGLEEPEVWRLTLETVVEKIRRQL